MADNEEENTVSAATHTTFDANQSISNGTETGEKRDESPNVVTDDTLKIAKAEIEEYVNNIISGVSSPTNLQGLEEDSIFSNRELDPMGKSNMSYAEPMQDPYQKSIQYLEKHNILHLFQTLTTNIVFKTPNDPLNFLIAEIGELKENYKSPKPK